MSYYDAQLPISIYVNLFSVPMIYNTKIFTKILQFRKICIIHLQLKCKYSMYHASP